MIFDRYRLSWNHLRTVAWPVITFEFWFSLIYVIGLTPPAVWLLNRLVVSGDQLAVSNYELLTFFLSIRGVLFLIFSIALFLALGFAEQAGLLIIAIGPTYGGKVSASFALWREIGHFPALVRLGLIQAVLYGAAFIPFAGGLALTYLVLLGDKDINYYLSARPWEWWLALAIAGTLVFSFVLVAAWLFVRWLFSVPALVFEDAAPADALKESWKRTRGLVWSLGLQLGVLWIGVLIASVATTWAFRTVAVQILKHVELKLLMVLPTVLVALAIMAIVDISLLITGKMFHTILVVSTYLENEETAAKPERVASKRTRMSPQGLRMLGWLGAVAALFVAAAAGLTFMESLNINRDIAITAHRGSSLKAPENTLSAIRQAVADGADYAEIDVQTAADGVVVLLHDADFMRVASVNRKLDEMSYDEIKGIDIGSWLDPEFAGERTPTLEEAIELAEGRIKLNIELKYNRTDPDLSRKVGQIVQKKQFGEDCVISSLNYAELLKTKNLYPEFKVGLIVFRALGELGRTSADFLSINASKATPSLVKEAHRYGKEVHVWTVNDVHNALTMMELGVDNIITDDPELLKKLFRSWNALSDTEKIALMLRNLFLGDNQPVPSQL